MQRKLNCWEFKNCGREKGGLWAEVYGVCPVAMALEYDGMNDGQAGGRVCWSLIHSYGSVCAGRPANSGQCHQCAFYRRVRHEEAEKMVAPLATTPTG